MNIRLSQFFIVGYLAVLGFGVWSQVVGSPALSHPAMYFTVWDMYQGYTPFEERRHLVAMGESGAFYDVSDPPWGRFRPYGSPTAGRIQYDFTTVFAPRFAQHVLDNTHHEPILRVLWIDELWNRKYNLSAPLWNQRYEGQQLPRSYFYVRAVYDPAGQPIAEYCDFRSNLAHQGFLKNPQLQETIARLQPFSALPGLTTPDSGSVQPAGFSLPAP